jgi:hypothetical protein
LSIATFSIKPANMKTTPSGTLIAVAVVGLALATVITLRAIAQPPPPSADPDVDKFVLTLKNKPGDYHALKDNGADGEKVFKKLLCDPTRHFDKTKKLHFKSGTGNQDECDLPSDCATCATSSRFPSPAQLKIKTDKITVANAAQSVADGDPHVTIQVASTSPDDIKAVLDSLTP